MILPEEDDGTSARGGGLAGWPWLSKHPEAPHACCHVIVCWSEVVTGGMRVDKRMRSRYTRSLYRLE